MATGLGKFGWFLGLVFGTFFAMLFAPRKGKELRANIKADRKKGKLGIAPLQEDFKKVGAELATIAREIYQSEDVQQIIKTGRSKVKDLSDNLVEGVADFQVRRVEPLAHAGRKTFQKATREVSLVRRKIEQSTRVGRDALKKIKGIIKKK